MRDRLYSATEARNHLAAMGCITTLNTKTGDLTGVGPKGSYGGTYQCDHHSGDWHFSSAEAGRIQAVFPDVFKRRGRAS